MHLTSWLLVPFFSPPHFLSSIPLLIDLSLHPSPLHFTPVSSTSRLPLKHPFLFLFVSPWPLNHLLQAPSPHLLLCTWPLYCIIAVPSPFSSHLYFPAIMIDFTGEVKDPITAADVISQCAHTTHRGGKTDKCAFLVSFLFEFLQAALPRVIQISCVCTNPCCVLLCGSWSWCSLGNNPLCVRHDGMGRNSPAVWTDRVHGAV